MKKFVILTAATAFLASGYGFCGVAKVSYKYVFKPAAKVAFHVAKPVAKGVAFPARHPKKDVHGAEKITHVAAKILY